MPLLSFIKRHSLVRVKAFYPASKWNTTVPRYDKSLRLQGVKQRIFTDGYLIPLAFHNGLPYILGRVPITVCSWNNMRSSSDYDRFRLGSNKMYDIVVSYIHAFMTLKPIMYSIVPLMIVVAISIASHSRHLHHES
jgi:hypothetical protein